MEWPSFTWTIAVTPPPCEVTRTEREAEREANRQKARLMVTEDSHTLFDSVHDVCPICFNIWNIDPHLGHVWGKCR